MTRGYCPAAQDWTALQELRAWQLVTSDPDRPDVPVTLDPKEAGRRRLDAELRELHARMAGVAEIQDTTDELQVHFERAKWRPGAGCEFLAEPEQVNARIRIAVSRASCELLTAQPGGPRSQKLLDIARERDTKALERGVTVRTLYRDNVRDDRVTRSWATTMTQKGAQFRTLASPFERCIIVDRKQAFISDYVPGAPQHCAWHVQDRAMVLFIAAAFEDGWRRADPWIGDPRTMDASEARTTVLQREILRDTAAGIDQPATAKRLGISPRTVSTEIGKLREMWGVATLAQLTYQWALSPERLIDDQPGEAAA